VLSIAAQAVVGPARARTARTLVRRLAARPPSVGASRSPRVCMLIAEEHRRHPIVRRQVRTLTEAGCSVTVIDQATEAAPPPLADYTAVRVRPVCLDLLARAVWIILRRLDPQGLGEWWWTAIHFTQVGLTGVRFVRRALRARADFYQAHDLNTLLPALVAGRLRRARVIYDAHELASEQGDPRQLRNAFERRLERWLVPAVDQLIVPNRARARFYAEHCTLRRSPLVVLNCPPLSTTARSRALHERLRLPAGTRVVLYHGALIPGRGLEQLVRAARYFDPHTVLVMIGEQGEFFEQVLAPLFARERLAERVFFLPYVDPDQVMRYVASADLGVVIYRNTNLNNYLCAPTKLYEYLMAEVPVVVSAFPEMLDVLSEYPVGRAFDPEAPTSIAAAVNSVLGEGGDRRQAFERARHRFTWETESQKLLAVFGLRVSPADHLNQDVAKALSAPRGGGDQR
jgi:glycosyltransferase involved in cell wall biosynthesis